MKEDIDDFELYDDDDLYANYDAFKALIDAGIPRSEALKRTGLTEQIVRDLEIEEEEMNLRSDFEEQYDAYDEDEEGFGEENWDDSEEMWDDDEVSYYDDGFDDDIYDENSFDNINDEF